MRRTVTGAMCGLSVVVVGMALRASTEHDPATVEGVAQPGLVTASPSASPSASPGASAATKRAAASRRATATAVPRATASPSASPKAAVSTRVNGEAVDTRYGPVQVQIVARAGRIVRAEAVEYPQGEPRDLEINSWAIPQLDQEAVQAQSAQIDTVSGATYTSDGYVGSLQSAIDAAQKAGVL